MYVESANQGQSSSILRPNLHLKQYPHITFDEKETVEMVRLDDLLPLLNLEKYDFSRVATNWQGNTWGDALYVKDDDDDDYE